MELKLVTVEAETVERNAAYWLTYSAWSPLPRGELSTVDTVANQGNAHRLAHQPIPGRQFLSCDSFQKTILSLCQVGKTNQCKLLYFGKG